ncbi:unnamed protein product [Parnassius apollo]|uniref:(apollo) hypothetical protein n=1 Tax=Parnassius apollo TaxID=110799 RepID=A0A8S3W8R5_PARAO|nr:unnamed protein product [Parnassius apollo]
MGLVHRALIQAIVKTACGAQPGMGPKFSGFTHKKGWIMSREALTRQWSLNHTNSNPPQFSTSRSETGTSSVRVTKTQGADLASIQSRYKKCTGAREIICSAYLPGENADPTIELERVAQFARKHKAKHVVGCDANAHHTAWGSTNINERGELLYDFLISNRLVSLNLGCTPTIVTRARQEVLDIRVTFATNNMSRRINDWHDSSENSMSDHKHIKFVIGALPTYETFAFRDPKATSWDIYRDRLRRNSVTFPKSIKTIEGLELVTETVTAGIREAFEVSCPVKTKTSRRKVPWWNTKLKKT